MDSLELVAPVVGLPVGPATEAGVRASVKVDDGQDDVMLAMAINAVNEFVSELPIIVDRFLPSVTVDGVIVPESEWRSTAVLGATFLAARLFGRRNSPFGIASFSAEGAVYVTRNDPDIALMLGIGAYQKPTVG